MGKIDKPTGLNDEELVAFLSEIEEDEDKLSAIQQERGFLHPDETLEDSAWDDYLIEGNDNVAEEHLVTDKEETIYLEEKKKDASKARALGTKNFKESARLKRERKQLIVRLAFKQNDILLSDTVSQEHYSALIELLTAEQRVLISSITEHINEKFTSLLSPLIPKALKICYAQFPNALKSNPGFMYIASKKYGKSLTFWATPDVPCFFQQGTENQILLEKKAQYLFTLDKYIIRLKETQVKLADYEVKFASRLVRMKEGTFYDLLKLDAFWFEILYNIITSKNLKDEQI